MGKEEQPPTLMDGLTGDPDQTLLEGLKFSLGFIVDEFRSARAAESFTDKATLTLAGGALGLSMTFFLKRAQLLASESTTWLKWSWFLLGASIVLTLLALALQPWVHLRRAQYFMDLLKSQKEPELPKVALWLDFIRRIVSLCLLIGGICLVAVFGLKNVAPREKGQGEHPPPAENATTLLELNPKHAAPPRPTKP